MANRPRRSPAKRDEAGLLAYPKLDYSYAAVLLGFTTDAPRLPAFPAGFLRRPLGYAGQAAETRAAGSFTK